MRQATCEQILFNFVSFTSNHQLSLKMNDFQWQITIDNPLEKNER